MKKLHFTSILIDPLLMNKSLKYEIIKKTAVQIKNNFASYLYIKFREKILKINRALVQKVFALYVYAEINFFTMLVCRQLEYFCFK